MSLAAVERVVRRTARPALVLAAVGLVVWAGLDPMFRDVEGDFRGLVCVPVAAGAACALLAVSHHSTLAAALRWVALATVGQALALQTIDAGRTIHYQHYRPLAIANATWGALVLVLLVGYATVVVVGVVAHRRELAHGLRAFGHSRVAIFLALFLAASATVSRDVGDYLVEVLFASVVQGLALANVCLAVVALDADARRWIGAALDRFLTGGRAAGLDRFAIAIAVWVLTVCAALAYFVYERHPHVPDEVVYLLHARYLAAGQLTMPLPPVRKAFDVDLMTYDEDRWYCPVPPGWPAVLALGVLAGVPWLVNPILGALSVLLASLALDDLFGRRTSRAGVVLLACSPWFLFMNMNLMTHSATLACALLGALGVARALRGRGWVWALVAGGAVGYSSLIRPLEGAVLAVVLGAWAVGLLGRRVSISGLLAFGAGVASVGALVFPYNVRLTGDPFAMPINVYLDRYYAPGTNSLGFGPNRGLNWAIDPFPGYSPLEGLVNAAINVTTLNAELFGWACGSLVLVLAWCLMTRRPSRREIAVAALGLCIVGVHYFYWFAGGPDFGPRYWYLCIIPCVVLTARGALAIGRPATVAAALLCALSLVTFLPWRAVDKYHHYLSMRPDVRDLADELRLDRSLVLVRGRRHPDYASASVYNPLYFGAEAPVYAWDVDPASTAAVLEAYADRNVWVLEGPTLTGRGYAVVEGPVPAREMLARLSRDREPGV